MKRKSQERKQMRGKREAWNLWSWYWSLLWRYASLSPPYLPISSHSNGDGMSLRVEFDPASSCPPLRKKREKKNQSAKQKHECWRQGGCEITTLSHFPSLMHTEYSSSSKCFASLQFPQYDSPLFTSTLRWSTSRCSNCEICRDRSIPPDTRGKTSMSVKK